MMLYYYPVLHYIMVYYLTQYKTIIHYMRSIKTIMSNRKCDLKRSITTMINLYEKIHCEMLDRGEF